MEINLTEDAKYWLKVYAVLDKANLKWENGEANGGKYLY